MTWDQYCQEIKIIEEYDDSHKIIYIKYIPDLPAQPREFVVFRYFFSKDLPEGKTIFIVYRSVNHPRIPVSSNRSGSN